MEGSKGEGEKGSDEGMKGREGSLQGEKQDRASDRFVEEFVW